jgi:hypothetical protein
MTEILLNGQGPPPASVRAMLVAYGYVEKPVTDGVTWWQDSAGRAGPWGEAVDRLSGELLHLRAVAHLKPKDFWRSREFLGIAVALLGIMGPALAMLAGNLSWVPEAHRAEIGAALMSASGIMVAVFARARTISTALAAVEQAKVVQSPPGGV